MAVKKNATDPLNPNAQPQPGILINEITIRPVIRTRQDIGKWRDAHTTAEWNQYQIRVLLYDLYDDILLDAVLSDQVDKLLMAVTAPQLQFLKDGKEVPQIQELIDTETFAEMLEEIVKTQLWGYTVLEFTFGKDAADFHVTSIPRKHIRPLAGKIATEQYGNGDIDYRQPPTGNYIIELGKPRDLGKLLKVAPYALFKRGGLSDWAQFSEIFGMPVRVAKYDASNQLARQEATKALNEAGAALAITIPKEVEFDLKQPTGNMTGDVYDKLIDKCDKQICLLILGQTETTMSSQSSGYAQSKTHQLTKAEVQEYTRKRVLRVLNSKVKAMLKLHGYPTYGGSFEFMKDEEELDATSKMQIWMNAKNQLGVPVNDDDVYEEFGIPKPENYDELKAQEAEQKQLEQEALKNAPVKDAKMRATEAVSLIERLRNFFDHAPK